VHAVGIIPLVPKSMTSNSLAAGRFDKQDFIYIAEDDEYRCPAGQRAIWRFRTVEDGLTIDKYWSSACPRCPMKAQCTTGEYRRITRWKHEVVLEAMQERLDRKPRQYASSTTNGGTSARHAQVLDGRRALPDQDAAARQHRNESSRARVQPKARDADPGDRGNAAHVAGLSPSCL
jgi:hypothetical protein